MSNALTFTIPGEPVPKERARTVRRGGRTKTFTPPRTATYEALVGMRAMLAAAEYRKAQGASWPTDARYAVHMLVVRSTRRACDLSNIAKAVEDGAQGVAGLWLDDAQIDELSVVRGRVDAHAPRVEVTVRRLASDPVQTKRQARADTTLLSTVLSKAGTAR
jgi:Holliday junction resolvase RusA-like endonuclease